jgi:hypothetical protein
VASAAGEADIAFSPAPAAFQPIGLEARIDDPYSAGLNDVGPGAVTSAAEIDRSSGIQAARIQD